MSKWTDWMLMSIKSNHNTSNANIENDETNGMMLEKRTTRVQFFSKLSEVSVINYNSTSVSVLTTQLENGVCCYQRERHDWQSLDN